VIASVFGQNVESAPAAKDEDSQKKED